MSSAVKLVANIANAQHSTGPRTDQGKAASSQNAVKTGLFSTRDFIRPGEESIYAQFIESLNRTLAPAGDLELGLADEIRRAMWRLRRCAETEGSMVEPCIEAAASPESPIPDAMQNEATAKLQFAVDRARAQSHRLLHRCTAELRKLQTDRLFRSEELGPAADDSSMGLGDLRVIRKSLDESTAGQLRKYKVTVIESQNAVDRELGQQMAVPEEWFAETRAEMAAKLQTQSPSRNSRCACGSGLKYKRCCALKAAA